MRRATKVAGAIGVLLALAAGLWLLIAPGELVKYPSDLDKTAAAKGTVTLYLDPETGAALDTPQQLPLAIQRRLQVVDSTGSQATVQETSTERIGPLPEQTLRHRFVIDRSTLENLTSSEAYAFAPGVTADRAPHHSINLPFDTGAGPYQVWKNEAGRAYPFRQTGLPMERDGVTLLALRGTLENVPVIPAYVEQLAAQGLPAALTPDQMAARLAAEGVDVEALAAELLPALAPAQRAAVQEALAQDVPLRYLMSVRTRLLVEPTTGAIVSLDGVEQTIGAVPDLSRLAPLTEILAAPALSGVPAAQRAGQVLGTLVEAEPTPVMSLQYGQTRESVADFIAYADDKADEIGLVETTIPLGLGILAALAFAVAALAAVRGRRVPPAPPAEPRVPAREERPVAHV